MSSARLEARMDSLFSFPVGLFHPLQHAGLSRRSTYYRTANSVKDALAYKYNLQLRATTWKRSVNRRVVGSTTRKKHSLYASNRHASGFDDDFESLNKGS